VDDLAAERTGYSEETADVQGSRLLKNVKVKKIDKLLNAQAKRSTIKADRVLRELSIT
jgi:phage terminase small subunit